MWVLKINWGELVQFFFLIFLSKLSEIVLLKQGGVTTLLYFTNVTNFGTIQFTNNTIIYKIPGDLTSYQVNIDATYYQDLSTLGVINLELKNHFSTLLICFNLTDKF